MTVHLHPERAARRTAAPSHRLVGAALFAALDDEHTNVLTWGAAVPPPLLARAARLLAAGLALDRGRWLAGPDWRVGAVDLVAEVPDPTLAEAVATLAARVAPALAVLTGAGRVRARLEVVDRETCPRLHADHVVVRALCTLAGPGTEWVSNADLHVDPLAVCGQDFAAVNRAIADPTKVRRAAPGDVILLKGAAWPGQRCGGAVHKAPPVGPGGARLVLKLDVPAPDARPSALAPAPAPSSAGAP